MAVQILWGGTPIFGRETWVTSQTRFRYKVRTFDDRYGVRVPVSDVHHYSLLASRGVQRQDGVVSDEHVVNVQLLEQNLKRRSRI